MRGEIDSCNHYFCFVCIMEWAKVKSCYPACKRRFKKIVRPNNGGDFASERVVRVLARDQANPHHFDPYVDTRCGVCGGMQDECYLLLCNLCDRATHTSIKQLVSILDIVREESSNRAAEILASMSAEAREPLVVMDKVSDFDDARTI
ncbi:hypothetical protein MLD38_031887 [Melastoma candidum]|uniref:Uncharacterized protein n=1 Tax=Melastoma candidum TaxID=119954 RepID=A0ACB9MR34_9MYRT|nr:hypothetical protein MLD38_031887 [Melastoma candidum]